ncbi:MAG: signal peptidase I [Pedosphaera sp. Tous-C6FEB]|nr:MAG: signal peptidase I [Pedosphaera sp. Tous-C6FEB]
MKTARWKPAARRFWLEWLKPCLVIVLVTTALRSALADWNDVPTGSMKPTILEGDRVWVNKLAYDLKVPFTTWHLAEWGDPQRGEVVVFFSPANGERMIKRIVGLPGDTVELRNNRLFLNGRAVDYAELDAATVSAIPAAQQTQHSFASEQLAERHHPVMATAGLSALRTFSPTKVPAGHYFMMGDNRDNSLDSRYFGPVAREQIVGRSSAVVLSLDRERWFAPRWNRWFTAMP